MEICQPMAMLIIRIGPGIREVKLHLLLAVDFAPPGCREVTVILTTLNARLGRFAIPSDGERVTCFSNQKDFSSASPCSLGGPPCSFSAVAYPWVLPWIFRGPQPILPICFSPLSRGAAGSCCLLASAHPVRWSWQASLLQQWSHI